MTLKKIFYFKQPLLGGQRLIMENIYNEYYTNITECSVAGKMLIRATEKNVPLAGT